MGLYTSLGKLPVWFEGNYKTTEKDRVRDLMIKGKNRGCYGVQICKIETNEYCSLLTHSPENTVRN